MYKPTSGIQWTPKHSWTSDKPKKQALADAIWSTFGSSVVVIWIELLIGNENRFLPLCASVVGIGIADHILKRVTACFAIANE